MLHVVKRRFALVHQPLTSSPPAEFADLKQRLTSIKVSLKKTSAALSAANRHWIIQIQEQRRFSERFHQSYPTTTDDTYRVAEEFAEGSQSLYDQFVRETADDVTAYNEIHKQVLIYIGEIETLEKEYSKLMAAKSEADRYQSKVDFMERSNKPTDEGKKARNLQKMDNERDMFKKLLREVVEKQKIVYAKHPVVFKAALTAYWLSHEKHVTLLIQSLEQTQRFAKAAEREMRELDIANWTPEMVEEGEGRRQQKHNKRRGGARARDVKESSDVVVEEVDEDDDEEQEDSFHSASTVPVDGSGEIGESPTNIMDTLAEGKGRRDRKGRKNEGPQNRDDLRKKEGLHSKDLAKRESLRKKPSWSKRDSTYAETEESVGVVPTAA